MDKKHGKPTASSSKGLEEEIKNLRKELEDLKKQKADEARRYVREIADLR